MSHILLKAVALAALSWGLPACSSDSAESRATAISPTAAPAPADSATVPGGAPRYQCPRHPEVASDQPGACSTCGMPLEHPDQAAGSGRTFEINLTTTPAAIVAGQPVQLSLRPQDRAAPGAPVPLALVHEQKLNLVIVSRDLSEFYRETPLAGADGAYSQEFTFKTGGDYVLFEDYTPAGDRPQLGRQEVTVSGPKRAAVKFEPDVLGWQGADGYVVKLNLGAAPVAGTPLTLMAKVGHNGQGLTDLENYLGARGQLVIISEDTKQCWHVQPQVLPEQRPVVPFQTQFDRAGRYRVFFQFNHGGKIRTADFVVNVAPGAGAAAAAPQ